MRIRCPRCGNTIGALVAGHWIVRKAGRELICREVISITCERCHAVWRPLAHAPVGEVIRDPPPLAS